MPAYRYSFFRCLSKRCCRGACSKGFKYMNLNIEGVQTLWFTSGTPRAAQYTWFHSVFSCIAPSLNTINLLEKSLGRMDMYLDFSLYNVCNYIFWKSLNILSSLPHNASHLPTKHDLQQSRLYKKTTMFCTPTLMMQLFSLFSNSHQSCLAWRFLFCSANCLWKIN